MKKNNEGNGVLFSGELKAVVKRLKRKEPELEHVLKAGTAQQKRCLEAGEDPAHHTTKED